MINDNQQNPNIIHTLVITGITIYKCKIFNHTHLKTHFNLNWGSSRDGLKNVNYFFQYKIMHKNKFNEWFFFHGKLALCIQNYINWTLKKKCCSLIHKNAFVHTIYMNIVLYMMVPIQHLCICVHPLISKPAGISTILIYFVHIYVSSLEKKTVCV